jgi:hypothetical protein
MNINQLNQNEYVDKSKEWTKNIEDVANKAEDMLEKGLWEEPDRSTFVNIVKTRIPQLAENITKESKNIEAIETKEIEAKSWAKAETLGESPDNTYA